MRTLTLFQMHAPALANAPNAADGAAPTASATELVTRPEPGLARGRWEAPAWMFWLVLVLVVTGAALYVLLRTGVLRLGKQRTDGNASPPSSPPRRP